MMDSLRKKRNIKVILWDIDGTLLDFSQSERYAMGKCFELLQLGVCSEEMLRIYSEINKGYWKRLERQEISKKEVLIGRFRDFFQACNLDVSRAEEFNEEYQRRLGDKVVFFKNGWELVKELRGKLLQYAVTNGTKVAQDRKLKNSGLEDMLDGVFISEEVGVEKPGIGFFQKVFQQIGHFSKDEILIVGDSLTSDIQGGINAGIITCWFNPERKVNNTDLEPHYIIGNLDEIRNICSYSEQL